MPRLDDGETSPSPRPAPPDGGRAAARAGRGALNVVLPGKVYQRGQILSWQRDKKYALLREYGIGTVVNFWPKLDPDMGEAPVDTYLHLACPRSEQVLEERVERAVPFVASLAARAPVLVLCEAGVTRSVYFCVRLVAELEGLSLPAAHARVKGLLRTNLKGFMLRRFAAG